MATNNRPFRDETIFDNLNTKLVQYSDPTVATKNDAAIHHLTFGLVEQHCYRMSLIYILCNF